MSSPRHAALLLEIQRDLAANLCRAADLGAAFRVLLDSAMKLPGFDCGGVYARDAASGALELLFHHGLSEEFTTAVAFHPADSPHAGLAGRGELIYAVRNDFPPEVAARIAREGLTALAIVPLRFEGRVLGTLNVSSHTHTRIAATSRVALESLAAQAEGVICLIHERDARRQAEEYLRLAVEGGAAGTWMFDLDADLTDGSPRSRDLLGIPRDFPLAAADPTAFIHWHDRQRVAARMRRALRSGEPFTCEFRTAEDPGRWVAAEARRSDHEGSKRLHGTLRDITRRKRAELDLREARDQLERRVAGRTAELAAANRTLRESEEKYRKLHESITDAYVSVDLSGRFRESNRAYQEMLGYTVGELGELSYVDITPDKWHAMEARLVAEQVLAHGASETYEKEYRRKDGSVFPVELRTFLVRDNAGDPAAMWAIVRDITGRKQAEQALRDWNANLEQRVAERTLALAESEARFRQLAEATFEGIAITEGGVVVDANPQLGVLLGGPIEALIGRPVMDLVAPESRDLVSRRIREGCEEPYEFTSMRLDGSTFPAEVHARNRRWQGREVRVSAVRDLSSVKQAAEQLLAQRAQLEQVQHLSLVSEISAGIMHQIVQPLTAATNHAAVVKLKVSRCEVHGCGCLPQLEKLDEALGGTRETIAHIRALTSPGHLLRGRINLSILVLGLERLLCEEAKDHSFEISLVCAADLPASVVDRVQIEQVVVNLVRNAFEAGATLGQERRMVRVSTHAAGEHGVELRVRDSGPGIAADIQPLLFTPFFTTKPGGSGIGLRLSQTIIKAHSGSIKGVNNTDGPGATFSFILPAVPVSGKPQAGGVE